MNPREARITRNATNSNMTWKKRANASTFIFSSPVKLPRTPIGEGQRARWRAFVTPRPIMSIVTNVARPVPARAKVQRRSGRSRQAKPRTAEASAVMTRIVSGRKTVYSDSSEPSEDSLGPRRDSVEDQDRQDAEHGEGDRQDRERRDLETAEVRHRLPFRVWWPEDRPLHRPDVIRRRENHREDRHEDEQAEGRIHADEDAELRDEPDEPGEAEGPYSPCGETEPRPQDGIEGTRGSGGTKYRPPPGAGTIGSLTGMTRNPPSLSRTPARITDPPVGASTWASGNHVWSGHVGNFVPKAMRSPTNARSASGPGGIGRVEMIAVMSNVCGLEYR